MTSTGEETETQVNEHSQAEEAPVTSLLEARRNLVAAAERGEEKAAERKPGDVSASTIARMMGLVTSAEFKVFETKLELISAKLTTLSTKLDKAVTQLADVAAAGDLERIDVQIAALRTLIKETLERQLTGDTGKKERTIVSNKT